MSKLKLLPDLPLMTTLSSVGVRGKKDYLLDLTSRLEAGELLTGTGASVLVVSSNTNVVEVTDQFATSKMVAMQLLAKADGNSSKFPLTVEYAGNSGTRAVETFFVALSTGDC